MPDSCAKALAPTTALLGAAAEADELGEQLAGGVELVHLDVVGVGELVAADHEGGGDLFERGVAGAFADAVDGALDLAGTALDAGEGVGDGHAEVVVAVGGEDDVFDAGDAGLDHAEDGLVLGGGGVADGVGDVDGGGSGLDGDGDHLERNSGSVRVPSSVENSTSSTKVRARRTDSAVWSSACSRVILSLASR